MKTTLRLWRNIVETNYTAIREMVFWARGFIVDTRAFDPLLRNRPSFESLSMKPPGLRPTFPDFA